ncbi:MAG: hypothetical protein H7Z40_21505 [Phycisphaerae bacterium]|nr:hypothetical protein [Gemmatimonadaceae bacterium]
MSGIAPGKSFVQITDSNGEAFAQLFAIYEESMPTSERKTRAAIAALVDRNDYHVVGMKVLDEVVAFFILFLSARHAVGLLEYMATKNSSRSRGLGSDLFKKAAELAGALPMLIEVDSERERLPDQHLRARRKTFYLRHGCRQMPNLDYLMPTIGVAEPPTMDLLCYWKDRTDTPSSDVIREWLERIYVEVYGCARDDHRIDLMVQGFMNGAEAQT